MRLCTAVASIAEPLHLSLCTFSEHGLSWTALCKSLFSVLLAYVQDKGVERGKFFHHAENLQPGLETTEAVCMHVNSGWALTGVCLVRLCVHHIYSSDQRRLLLMDILWKSSFLKTCRIAAACQCKSQLHMLSHSCTSPTLTPLQDRATAGGAQS